MPELPEVEIIKLGLEKRIIGKSIKKLEVLTSKSVEFKPELIEGAKVVGIFRRAKMLGIELTADFATPKNPVLLFHLKMTGQLILESGDKSQESRIIGGHPTDDMKDQMPNKSTRAILEFDDQTKLYFNDQRKFGWMKLVESDDLFKDLGPEPLEKDFTWQTLRENLLKHPNQPVKLGLMDQTVVAGVGNIYASESLFLARIDPRRKINTLSDVDFKDIYQAVKDALELAISKGGSTRSHFRNIEGEKGEYLDFANVYGKDGEECPYCKGKIKKISLGGRGTFFCPTCQK